MEERERFVIELFLGMILVVFLVLLTFLVVGNVDAKESNIQPTGINVVNSYNNYAQLENERQRENQFDSRQRIQDNRVIYYDSYDDDNERGNKRFYKYDNYDRRDMFDDDENYRYVKYDRFDDEDDYDYDERFEDDDFNGFKYKKTFEKPLEFDDDGRQRRYQNLFNKDVDNFEVYVYNEEEAGGYFEVTFTFEDSYGREIKSSETKYIHPEKEQKFFYKDVSPHNSEYKNWNYKVKSHSEVPYKTVYYN